MAHDFSSRQNTQMRSFPPPIDGTCENSSDRYAENDRPKSCAHHCRGVLLDLVARFTSVANKYKADCMEQP